MNKLVRSKPEVTFEAKIIRKDGKIEELGKIYSSDWLKNLFIQLKLKLRKLWQQS